MWFCQLVKFGGTSTSSSSPRNRTNSSPTKSNASFVDSGHFRANTTGDDIKEMHSIEVTFSSLEKFGFVYTANKVTKVYPNSQAANLKVHVGWYILTINGKTQSRLGKDINAALKTAKQTSNTVKIEFSETQNQITTVNKVDREEKKNVQRESKHHKVTRQSESKHHKEITLSPDELIGLVYMRNKVHRVHPESRAYNKGIKKGWIILKINGQAMTKKKGVVENAFNEAKKNKKDLVILFSTTKPQPAKVGNTVLLQNIPLYLQKQFSNGQMAYVVNVLDDGSYTLQFENGEQYTFEDIFFRTIHVPNKEGEDLIFPLQSTGWTQESLTDVTYYGSSMSPPCCKIRTILNYYGVPYKTVKGKKPGSTYRKIPVLDINGRQINDSFIMVKHLAWILDGKPLSDEQLRIEKMISFGLMIAMERSVAMSVHELCLCSKMDGLGFLCCLAPCIASCCGPSVGKGKDLKKIVEYGQELKDFLKGKQFFSGLENPGINDISLYGVIEPFQHAKNAVVNELLGSNEDPLRIWHNTMKSKLVSIWDEGKVVEFDFA